MTKISYIHGTEERRQRAAELPERSLINYTAMTEGETRLVLLAEQVQMLAAYYPEDKELQRSKQILQDVLYKGLHRSGNLPGGIFTGRLATVMSEVRAARQMARPAAGVIIGRRGVGIGDPLIPYEDCTIYEEDDWTGQMIPTDIVDPGCVRANNIKKILNDNLEKSSHHILYNFVTNPNASPSLVAVKTQNHRATTSIVAQISKLSATNLRLWIRNGVIRNNIQQGAGALQPEEAIQVFKSGSINGIGVIETAALVAIIKAIAAAIAAAGTLVAAFKQRDPQTAALWAQLQGIGTGVFGPEQQDWYTSQNQQNGGPGNQPPTETELDKILPIGLIALGAFTLLD